METKNPRKGGIYIVSNAVYWLVSSQQDPDTGLEPECDRAGDSADKIKVGVSFRGSKCEAATNTRFQAQGVKQYSEPR